MSDPRWIASSDVVFVEGDGTRLPGTIRISVPELRVQERDAQCTYALAPLEKERVIFGVDTLQALLFAIQMCANDLARFERRGGKILFPSSGDDGSDEHWDPETTFGALFRLSGADAPGSKSHDRVGSPAEKD